MIKFKNKIKCDNCGNVDNEMHVVCKDCFDKYFNFEHVIDSNVDRIMGKLLGKKEE